MSWEVASLALLALTLAIGFAWYEREKPPARVLALVAALAALAVVGRLAFAAIPNVKPTTDIVLFAGYALGGAPGFAVGAVTAVVSNIFLSQGPWTAWQMAGWGAVGVGGALLARAAGSREPNRFVLAAVCALAGLGFGAWMDVYQWTLAARQDLDTYVAVAGTSLPYNIAHAVGNFLFCLLIGPAFVRALRRYRRRLEVRWERAHVGAGVAAAALAALALAGGADGVEAGTQEEAPRASVSAKPAAGAVTGRAVRYLLRAQNPDGGFGSAPRERSSGLYTGWAGLGLAAAGRNPRDVRRRSGRSIAAYLKRSARSVSDIGEIERTILLLKAAGLSARGFGGRDLVARVKRRRRGDGSIGGFVSYTAFGVLALRAAGESAGRASLGWLARAQNADGGFGVAPSSTSDSDMTGAVLQALAATGRAKGAVARRAVRHLRGTQNGDGGFGQMSGRGSNAQSTAYAVQGLVAVGAGREAVRRALRYLAGLQRSDGSIAYSETGAQTPVWVTAQALAALRREPLPLGKVPRGRTRAARSPAPTPAPAATPPAATTPGPAAGSAPAAAPTAAVPRSRTKDGASADGDDRAATAPKGAQETETTPRRRQADRPSSERATTVEGTRARAGGRREQGPSAGLLATVGLSTVALLLLVRRLRWRRP